MKKESIIKELNISFDKMIAFIKKHDDNKFSEVFIENKWTVGQHVEHLIMTTGLINKAMKMPKLALRYKFGICNRDERNFQELVDKYSSKLEVVDTRKFAKKFAPRFLSNSEKEETLERLDNERHKMIATTLKWSERNLSKYVLPHPLLGKMTIREFLYFSILHTDHHRNVLKNKYMVVA